MGSLVDYAEKELKRIGMIGSGEPYNEEVAKAILDLIELFASQGHSGFTASYTVNAFKRLAMFKPLTPLTGKDDEWNEIEFGFFQNKRYSAVFKDGKDGKAYNIEGKIFSDDGEVWYSNKDSRIDITFPYTVPEYPEQIILKEGEEKEMTIEEIKNMLEIVDLMLDNKYVSTETRAKLHKKLEEVCNLAIKELEQESKMPHLTDIELLGELRAGYNCFEKDEEPYYRALSVGIKAIRDQEEVAKAFQLGLSFGFIDGLNAK